jgi:hypothetical protein
VQDFFGVVAVLLFLASVGAYARGIFLKQVRPHFFTWFIWVVSVSIIFAAQIESGAGPGAWTTALSVLFCIGVAIYAWLRGDKNFTRGDWASLIVALMAVPVWYITRQPAYAAVITTVIDAIAYYPTFRKSYSKPYEENLFCFTLDSMRHCTAFLALSHVSVATAAYPVTIGFLSFTFVAFALWRRYKIKA